MKDSPLQWHAGRQSFGAITVCVMVLAALSGACGALPPLPSVPSVDGGVLDTLDGAWDRRPGTFDAVSSDHAAVDLVPSPAVDASAALDSQAKASLDASTLDGSRVDAQVADAPLVPVCPTGYADCNGDIGDGCETPLTTIQHCGGCKKACGSVANGSAACVSGKCAVKCTAPYQDCDGKYDNGCEIPVGQGNSCDRSGLASFSGSKPPCGTPYCGTAAASDEVANFGTWYCSFCEHCYIFGNGGAYCLFSPGNGDFSGERCANCCAAGGSQVCPR